MKSKNIRTASALITFLVIIASNYSLIKALKVDHKKVYQQNKTALIFGITGQDGAYLTDFLLDKGYKVFGVIRRTSCSYATSKLDYILKNKDKYLKDNLIYLYGDVTDFASVYKLINSIKPDEIYNLAAQSDVKISFEKAVYTAHVNALGALNILEAICDQHLINSTKLFHASSCEIFGKIKLNLLNEDSLFFPRSPYGIAKVYAHLMGVSYRNAYGVFVCNGILFNHESPLRGENFVTRVISQGVAKIKLGLIDHMSLGNLNARRDWGYAKDYVEAMWLMLQQDKADDYVIATGEEHSVRELVTLAFKEVGINIEWLGVDVNEVGYDKKTGKKLIVVDPKKFRPTEANIVVGDSSKAQNVLGWQRKVAFHHLISMMVKHDLNILQKQLNKEECIKC